MAEEEIQHRATEQELQRSLTAGLAAHFVEGVGTGTGILALQQGAKMVGQLLHPPPPEPPPKEMWVPPTHKED
jgi:hypothetical protein